MNKLGSVVLLILLNGLLIFGQPANPSATLGNATKVLNLINAYRASNSVKLLNISKALMHVSQRHATDSFSYNSNNTCLIFSWSNNFPAGVSWTPCCYAADNSNFNCSTNKGKEITKDWTQPFTGTIQEMAATLTGPFSSPEETFFGIFKNNTAMRGWMLDSTWQVFGVGIAGTGSNDATKRSCFVSFSKTADPNVWDGLAGNWTNSTATPSTPPSNPPSTPPSSPPPSSGGGVPTLTGENPETLVNLVNAYRVNNSLAALAISKALMYTGQYHASAILANPSTVTNVCTLLSWPQSNFTGVTWEQCCYAASNPNINCSTNKPKQITSGWTNKFTADGYEIAGSLMGYTNVAHNLFNNWINGTDFRNFFLGQGTTWGSIQWKSIGAGIANDSAGNSYGFLWLSPGVDNNVWEGFVNSNTNTTPPATPPGTPPTTPPGTPPTTPPATPPGTPPTTPPVTPPNTPPSTPPSTPPGTPPSTPPGTPPSTPPGTPPSTPPNSPPGGTPSNNPPSNIIPSTSDASTYRYYAWGIAIIFVIIML